MKERISGWSKRTKIVACVIALGLISLVVKQWLDVRWLNQPLVNSAESLMDAWESGNDRRIYSMMIPQEQQMPGMSLNTLEQFNAWTRECYKDFSDYQRTEDIKDDTGAEGLGGDMWVCDVAYKSDGKISAYIGFLIYRTDEGPQAFWMESALFGSLKTKYGLVGLAGKEMWAGQARVLDLERPVLESMGLEGIVVQDKPAASFKTWDELVEKYKTLAGVSRS